jgi:hypothetical protein
LHIVAVYYKGTDVGAALLGVIGTAYVNAAKSEASVVDSFW